MLAPGDDVGLPNILIVDDRADNLLVLEAVLADSREYRVVTAASGFEAIELVKMRNSHRGLRGFEKANGTVETIVIMLDSSIALSRAAI